MTDSTDKLLAQFELYFNQQRADLMVFRVTLQMFLIRVIAARPEQADEVLLDMKTRTLGALGRVEPGTIDPQGDARAKQLTLARADEFFQELEVALAGAQSKKEPGAPN